MDSYMLDLLDGYDANATSPKYAKEMQKFFESKLMVFTNSSCLGSETK